jgi:hypothetical protein
LVPWSLAEIDRLGHLAPHPLGAGSTGVDQPRLGAFAEREECLILCGLRPWSAFQRTC